MQTNGHYDLQGSPWQCKRALIIDIVRGRKIWEGRPINSGGSVSVGDFIMLQKFETWVVVRICEIQIVASISKELLRNGYAKYVPGAASLAEACAVYADLYPNLNVHAGAFCFYRVAPVEFFVGQTLVCGGCDALIQTKPAYERKRAWRACHKCGAYLCGACKKKTTCQFCSLGRHYFFDFEFTSQRFACSLG